jgi:hypothetical protein
MSLTRPLHNSHIPTSDKLRDLHPAIAAKLHNSSKRVIRYAAVSVSEVLDRVIPVGGNGRYENWTFLDGISANVTPIRLRTFKNNLKCVCCGREGNVFLIERHVNQPPERYINLYSAHNGSLTLMTVDHILCNSLGGKYAASNFQTMCAPCNQSKSNSMSLVDIQKIMDNVDQYAKFWVNRELLFAILRTQLMYQRTNGKDHQDFRALFDKYRLTIRPTVPQHQTDRNIRGLNRELNMLMRLTGHAPSNPYNYVVDRLAKVGHRLTNFIQLIMRARKKRARRLAFCVKVVYNKTSKV